MANIITNGTCTCDLQAESYGWTENALITWSAPKLSGTYFGIGYTLLDIDPAPVLLGEYILSDAVSGAEIVHGQTSLSGTPFNSSIIVKEALREVDNGIAVRFKFVIKGNITFQYVSVKDPSGNTEKKENVLYTGGVQDMYLFRQRDDTESWGSPNRKFLDWPFQDYR